MPVLIVPADDVAVRAGLPIPLTVDRLDVIEAALEDAQDDLIGYLGRQLVPVTHVETGLFPNADGTWNLSYYPLIAVVTAVAESYPDGQETGLWTVTYRAGLDAVSDPELSPLRRYVRTHALWGPEVRRLVREYDPSLDRIVRAATVDGQSVQYETAVQAGQVAKPGSGAAGSMPTLETCAKWRIGDREVFQRPGVSLPWPYDRRPSPMWSRFGY